MVKKITKWFYLEPLILQNDWLHLAEISQKLKINHTVVRKYLSDFENQGIIKKQKKGRLSMYKLNKEYGLIIDAILVVEKEKLLKQGLIIKEIANFFHDFNEAILIFGSAVENIKKANDVDILLVGKKPAQLNSKIKKLENKVNKKIHLVNVNKLEEISETLKQEIRKKHILINNSECFIKWLI